MQVGYLPIEGGNLFH